MQCSEVQCRVKLKVCCDSNGRTWGDCIGLIQQRIVLVLTLLVSSLHICFTIKLNQPDCWLPSWRRNFKDLCWDFKKIIMTCPSVRFMFSLLCLLHYSLDSISSGGVSAHTLKSTANTPQLYRKSEGHFKDFTYFSSEWSSSKQVTSSLYDSLSHSVIDTPIVTNASQHVHPWLATCVSLFFLFFIIFMIITYGG